MDPAYNDKLMLAVNFNGTVNELLKILAAKTRSEAEIANIDRAKRRMHLLRSQMGDIALIDEAAPHFYDFEEKIAARNEEFFNGMDARAEILARKGRIDPEDEFVIPLFESVRAHYNAAQQTERDHAYSLVSNLLTYCMQYLSLTDN